MAVAAYIITPTLISEPSHGGKHRIQMSSTAILWTVGHSEFIVRAMKLRRDLRLKEGCAPHV